MQNKHGLMAFNLRDFDDEKKAKMGVVECVKNKLIEPYQVLYEKPGKYIDNPTSFELQLLPVLTICNYCVIYQVKL